MDTHCIYKLTSPNGKIYIGQTNNFENRMNGHKNASKKIKNKLYKSVSKYGWDSFKKEILCEVIGKDTANKLEEEFIQAYNSYNKNGLNTLITSNGGNVWYGRYDTDEYMEFVEKMQNLTKGDKNGMFGRNHSSEAKQKQKEKAKGRYSLDWFIDRNGKEEGERLYEERRIWLKSRNLKKDKDGRFIKQ
jgi:group I intron endonuclease